MLPFAHLWHSIEKTHTNIEINYLMVQMTEIEEEILIHYGLPFTLTYSDIFQELGIRDNFELSDINCCINELEQAAKAYLLGPVKTDLEILTIAQESQLEIDVVLPELTLKLLPESYYFFCYYFLFLKWKITPKAFLDELKLVEKFNFSQRLSKLIKQSSLNFKGSTDYQKLKKIGLIFLDDFLINYQGFYKNQQEYNTDGLLF